MSWPVRRRAEERAPAGNRLHRLAILEQEQQVLVDLLRVGGQVGGHYVGGDGKAVRAGANDHALAHLVRAGFRVRGRVRVRVGVGVGLGLGFRLATPNPNQALAHPGRHTALASLTTYTTYYLLWLY